MCWFQIWCQKLSTALLSEDMNILIFKFREFKISYPFGKRLKKFIVIPNANSRYAPASLFLPSGSSESPTPASAEGASFTMKPLLILTKKNEHWFYIVNPFENQTNVKTSNLRPKYSQKSLLLFQNDLRRNLKKWLKRYQIEHPARRKMNLWTKNQKSSYFWGLCFSLGNVSNFWIILNP